MVIECSIYYRVVRVELGKLIKLFNILGKRLWWIRLGCSSEGGGKICFFVCGFKYKYIRFFDWLDVYARKRKELY